jgi:hypothetical protein
VGRTLNSVQPPLAPLPIDKSRRYRTLRFTSRAADNEGVNKQRDEPRPGDLLRLVAWFSVFAMVAVLLGRFAAFPWKASAFLLIPLELATLCAVMFEDDWEHNFRGDSRVFVRGTLASIAVVAGFTAVGVALRGL